MEFTRNDTSTYNNYYFYGIIAIIIIILIILVIYFATRPTDNSPEPSPPDPDNNFTKVLSENIGNIFIIRAPNATLDLTFQGFDISKNKLLPNNFTVTNCPFTLSFKYTDVFVPSISTAIGDLYSIYTTSEYPIKDVFNYTVTGYKSIPQYISLNLEKPVI